MHEIRSLKFRPEFRQRGKYGRVSSRQASGYSSLHERKPDTEYIQNLLPNQYVLVRMYSYIHQITSHSPRLHRASVQAMRHRYLKRTRSKLSKLNEFC